MCALIPATALAGSAAGKPVSDEVLQRLVNDYGHLADQLVASGKTPGLVTAIVYRDQVVLEKSVGVVDVDSGKPVEPTTVFRLASLSKGFTSALAGLMVADGQLAWDTRVADVLTYFRMHNDRATDRMTVRDLLSHRTGLPRNAFDNLLEEGESYRELVRRLDKVNLTCDVGECYSYQNIAFSIFGDMVYPLTGDFFKHQIAKRIFQPLAMNTASFGRDALENSASWARPHVWRGKQFVSLGPKPNYYWVSPAAGVNASIRDMEKWLAAQMGANPDVFSARLLQQLHKPEVDTPYQTRYSRWRRVRLRGASYALGWRVYDYNGHALVYHAGAVQGYRAIIGFFPEYRIGMVALWNCSCSFPGRLMPAFADRVLQLPSVDWLELD